MGTQGFYFTRVMVWAQTLNQAHRSGVVAWIEQAQKQYEKAVQDAEQAGFPVE